MKYILLSISFLFLFGCHQNLSAVNLKPAKGVSKSHGDSKISESGKNQEKPSFNDLQKGNSFKSGRETFVFLPELYSVFNRQKKRKSVLNSISAIQNKKSATLMKKKGRFQIYKSGKGLKMSAMSSESTLDQTLYPVVLNQRTNNLGIVLGNIKVDLDNVEIAEDLAKEFNLKIQKKFAHLKIVFFSVKEGQDIMSIHQNLVDDSRVKSASIEVLESLNTPQ